MSASSEASVVLRADLHARPAGQVTRAAATHDATVWLACGTRAEVDARSVLAVMGMGAVAGETVRVRAEGPEALPAVAAVVAVLAAAEAVAG
jgi:phosphotransferase system HPr (HPr) family protein